DDEEKGDAGGAEQADAGEEQQVQDGSEEGGAEAEAEEALPAVLLLQQRSDEQDDGEVERQVGAVRVAEREEEKPQVVGDVGSLEGGRDAAELAGEGATGHAVEQQDGG